MPMGFIDPFQFLGTFAILEDLTDCSSDTATYVERRRSSSSQHKSKSKSKQSTTTATPAARPSERVHEYASSKQHDDGAIIVKGPETARSTTLANVNVKEEDAKLREIRTNVSTKRSVANEAVTKQSIVTAPAILGGTTSKREGHGEEGQRKQKSRQEEMKEEFKDEKRGALEDEVMTNARETIRSLSKSIARSRECSRVTATSEAGTKQDVSIEELRKENRALRKRTERLEKDLASYRRHAEHYRDRRRQAEQERQKAEERVRELETVVTNQRDSYELELEDLRGQITEYAAKTAAIASATQLYSRDITGGMEERSQAPLSKHGSSSKAPTVKDEPSMRDESIQTDPWVPPLPSNPAPATLPTTESISELSLLRAKLEQRDAELIALRLFHEETPQVPLNSLADSVRALNLELRNLASSIAGSVALRRSWEAMQAWALDAAEPSIARCLRLLSGVKGADFSQDPTLVRLAVQAWIVFTLQRVFERFLFGLDNAEDEVLRRVYERLQAQESPSVAARWRALAHRHARTLATLPVESPSTSLGGFTVSRNHAIKLLEMDVLVGAEAILRFAGAHNPPGVLFSELSSTHGRRISRLIKRAARLASDLAVRAPVGCEVFTVHVGDDGVRDHGETVLCGCMESVDQECRQWIGQTARTERGGRTTGTRTRTHTRAGTVRNKSKTRSHRSHARTATTRTWADTNIRYWDKDSDDEIEEDSEEEDEAAEDVEEDEFAENIDVGSRGVEGGEHPVVLCSLGFGLRRIIKRSRRKIPQGQMHAEAPAASGGGPQTQPGQETLQRQKPRVSKPEVETIHGSQSDAKSTYTFTSLAATPRITRKRRSGSHAAAGTDVQGQDREGTVREDALHGREVEVLVKTDVLISSTVDELRKRVAQ